MERAGLLIAVLGNITALLHNIISQMCKPCQIYHARTKSKTSKRQKHWMPFCSGLRSVLCMNDKTIKHSQISQN